MKEAERMLKQMDLELTTNSNLDGKIKNSFTTYKKKYEDMKSKYFVTKENYTYTKKMEEMILTTQREAALDVNNSINSETELTHSQKLLEKEVLVGKSGEKLERAKRSALEIENTSKNVMLDLESQTQKLNSAQLKINGLNTSLDTSGSIITRIMDREHRNKAIIGIFSVTLVTLFVLILCSRS